MSLIKIGDIMINTGLMIEITDVKFVNDGETHNYFDGFIGSCVLVKAKLMHKAKLYSILSREIEFLEGEWVDYSNLLNWLGFERQIFKHEIQKAILMMDMNSVLDK